MTRWILRRGWVFVHLSILTCLFVPAAALAESRCEEQARHVSPPGERYFMVLAGRAGTFYEGSGPAFSMVIKTTGTQPRFDAVGIYADNGQPVFGVVPPATYVELMKEPGGPSDVMLRVEITQPEYERALTILRTWDRRAREGALLYPEIGMDNILLVKQVTEGLNACGERLKLYTLDWGLEDTISEHNLPLQIPFKYFVELRRLNEGRHLRDRDLPVALQSAGHAPVRRGVR